MGIQTQMPCSGSRRVEHRLLSHGADYSLRNFSRSADSAGEVRSMPVGASSRRSLRSPDSRGPLTTKRLSGGVSVGERFAAPRADRSGRRRRWLPSSPRRDARCSSSGRNGICSASSRRNAVEHPRRGRRGLRRVAARGSRSAERCSSPSQPPRVDGQSAAGVCERSQGLSIHWPSAPGIAGGGSASTRRRGGTATAITVMTEATERRSGRGGVDRWKRRGREPGAEPDDREQQPGTTGR
jgi:hypothetical protein